MTLTDKTDISQTHALEMEFDLQHPPEKVWRALTDPELLSQWLLPAVGFKPERGAAFMFKTQPQGNWDGTVGCRILEIEPPRRLSYAWDVGDLATTVTFALAATKTGTRMTVVQSGFREDQKQNFGGARYGWKMMGGRLVDLLGRIS